MDENKPNNEPSNEKKPEQDQDITEEVLGPNESTAPEADNPVESAASTPPEPATEVKPPIQDDEIDRTAMSNEEEPSESAAETSAPQPAADDTASTEAEAPASQPAEAPQEASAAPPEQEATAPETATAPAATTQVSSHKSNTRLIVALAVLVALLLIGLAYAAFSTRDGINEDGAANTTAPAAQQQKTETDAQNLEEAVQELEKSADFDENALSDDELGIE